MPQALPSRRLAALLFTDIVGYSTLTERNEKATLELVEEHRRAVRALLPNYGGSEVKTTGDGFLLEFSSVIAALECAIEIQTAQFERNLTLPEERRLQIRIGAHLGDIMDSERDRFGNEVNVTARIESLARPGGIAITQPVADQMQGKLELPLRSLGKRKLKNLTSSPQIFQIVMPWETETTSIRKTIARFLSEQKTSSSFFAWEGRLLTAQVVGVIALIGWVATAILRPSTQVTSPELTRYILPDAWQYALAKEPNSNTGWKEFDPAASPEIRDELNGDYLLRLEFRGAPEYKHPSLLVGLVSDSHRAYLNGQFIGGTERFSDVAHYSFDPSLVRKDTANTLLIKANTRLSLTPGIYPLSGTPPFLGEFSDVSAIVQSNELSYRVLQSVFLAVSLVIAFAGLGYSFIRRNQLKFQYFSLFLFLGTLSLSFYNSYVINALDYPAYRLIKVLTFGLSSFALFSSSLHSRGLRRSEVANNAAAIGFGIITSAFLVGKPLLPSAFVPRYDAAYLVATLYTIGWVMLLLASQVREWVRRSREVPVSAVRRGDHVLVLGFGLVLALIGTATSWHPGFSESQHDRIRFASLLYPFAFALLVLFNGVIDYVSKSIRIAYKQKKDELLLAIGTLTSEGTDSPETIYAIQQKITSFLGATRSTIYLAEEKDGVRFLKATYVQGSAETKRRIESTVLPETGVIGTCVKNRAPLWVEDIAKDPRFQGTTATRESPSSYRTGSFIVIPLIFRQRLLGVITVADRADGKPFPREDFCLLHLASKDLAALLGNVHVDEPAAKLRLVA